MVKRLFELDLTLVPIEADVPNLTLDIGLQACNIYKTMILLSFDEGGIFYDAIH